MFSTFTARTRALRGSPALAAGLFLLLSAHAGHAATYTHKIVHNFCAAFSCNDGEHPMSGLVMAPSGKLYGTTYDGGINEDGTIYELHFDKAKQKWKLKTIFPFSCDEEGCPAGDFPTGNLIVDVQGNLYGTTTEGGPGWGAAFELARGAEHGNWTLKVLYAFCSLENCTDGAYARAGLTYAGATSGAPYDGVSPLYGTTAFGGSSGGGIVYELDPNGGNWTETVLHNFCSQNGCTDGSEPLRGLTVDENGNLFGVTEYGGASNNGVVFELTQSGGNWSETVLHSFCAAQNCTDGDHPSSELLLDGVGDLIGATSSGDDRDGLCCGTIFKLAPNGAQSQYSVLYRFCQRSGCPDGVDPVGPLTMDEAGNVYGTARYGGGYYVDEDYRGGGTVFRLSGSSLKPLYQFCAKPLCFDGQNPISGATLEKSGNLLGTTRYGGKDLAGTIFELSR